MPGVLELAEVAAAMAATAEGRDGWGAVAALAERVFGPSLFTVNRALLATHEMERLYSSDAGQYAVGGRKQKRGTEWARLVLDAGELFVSTGPDAIRAHFDDHGRILGLGIAEIVNQPVRLGGRTLAVMNLSRPVARFHPAERPTLLVLAGLLLPLVLSIPAR